MKLCRPCFSMLINDASYIHNYDNRLDFCSKKYSLEVNLQNFYYSEYVLKILQTSYTNFLVKNDARNCTKYANSKKHNRYRSRKKIIDQCNAYRQQNSGTKIRPIRKQERLLSPSFFFPHAGVAPPPPLSTVQLYRASESYSDSTNLATRHLQIWFITVLKSSCCLFAFFPLRSVIFIQSMKIARFKQLI